MRKILAFVGAALLSGTMALAEEPNYLMAAPKPPEPIIINEAWGGHASYVVGYKGLGSKWGSAESQIDVGALDIDLRPPQAPVSIALQALVSLDDQGPKTLGESGDFSRTTELNIGLRKVFENPSQVEPFIGGGLAVVNAEATSRVAGAADTQNDSTWGIGAWGGGGVYWHITNELHVGVAAQYTWAQAHLFDQKLNVGGFHAMLLLGVHW